MASRSTAAVVVPDLAVERARETEERLGALYDGDADRELADLEADRHPLQHPR